VALDYKGESLVSDFVKLILNGLIGGLIILIKWQKNS
jgi:hypothetical protein